LKKRRRKLTVVAPTSLNAKSETETLLDAAPRETLLSRNADGSKLLTRIPKYNDSCGLMIEADTPCWPDDKNLPKFDAPEDLDVEEIMSIFGALPVSFVFALHF